MATKKKSAKKRKGGGTLDVPVPGDAPIIVGGGGSVYVWQKLDLTPTTVNPASDDPNFGVNPGAPKPERNRDKYSCVRNLHVHKKIFFFNGKIGDPEQELKVEDAKQWYLRFEK
jgi:hypothetical protein